MPLHFQIIFDSDFKPQVHKNSTDDIFDMKKIVKLFISNVKINIGEQRDCCS